LYPTPIADLSLIASQEDVEAAISNPECTILDVRSDLEYTGQRFWPSGAPQDNGRSGHVPGAVNVPIDLLLGEDGKLKNVEALSAEFEKAAVDANKKIITYCTIGNRASNAWWGLTHLLGFPNVSVYYGSWSEWGTSPDTPIES
jgi:thiosulfate/3-mercaptopyruvate sulfurtransferase